MSSYWQLDLPPEEQEWFSVIIFIGLYQPTCMPQGLCNTPDTFQRAMENILSNLKLSSILFYHDDIKVFSKTLDKHLNDLEDVFKLL